MGAVIFAGLIVLVVAFSLLAHYGLLAQYGTVGVGLTVGLVLVVMLGIHRGMRRIQSSRFRAGIKDPLFMRAFMQSCWAGDCGRIEKVLADPEKTPLLILNDLLAAKMRRIFQTDARIMVDVQDKFTQSGLRNDSEPVLDRLFQSPTEYALAPRPAEIEHIIQAVTTTYPRLKAPLEHMLAARAELFTLMGDYLDIMPPSPRHFKFVKQTYRYRPPDDATTRRIAFALDTLSLLVAYKDQALRGERLSGHGRLAAERIPMLAAAVDRYKTTFDTLVEAYEAMPAASAPKATRWWQRIGR
jgi:hypothetical protein